MARPLILDSANTWLAYSIAERYYGGIHYAWCAPQFDARSLPSYHNAIPPSSNPAEIIQTLTEDIRRGDLHSAKIKENRYGIGRGARAQVEAGRITEGQRAEIERIVGLSQLRDFRPVLYVIPYRTVAKLVEDVPIDQRAHPLSVEYIIAGLRRRHFDLLELPRI